MRSERNVTTVCIGWRCSVRTTQDGNWAGEKGHKKGHKNVPFWVLDGFAKISASALERMAGTTRLELATSAVTGQRSNQLNYVPNSETTRISEHLDGQGWSEFQKRNILLRSVSPAPKPLGKQLAR